MKAPDDAEYMLIDGTGFLKNIGSNYHYFNDGKGSGWNYRKGIPVSCSFIKIIRQQHGTHYEQMKIQPVDFIHANNIGFLEGNVIKYVCRHGSKNGEQDIDKAIHYLQLIKRLKYPEK